MAMQQNPGFLAALGLDVNKEEILRQQKRQQQADAIGLAESLGHKTAHEQGAANIGALLGARLAKPEGLTSDQENKVRAAEAADKRMQEWMRANDKADPASREEAYLGFVADEAFRNGLADVGTQASTQLDERRKLRKLQAVELEAAGLKVPQLEANLKQTRASADVTRGVGGFRDVYAYGENDPNKGRYAWIDPATGDALTGPGGQVLHKAGQYTDQAPTRPDVWGRGGRGAGFGATNTEMGGVREAHAALYRRGATLNEMRDVLEESIDNTGTLAATGNAGKLTAWVGRWANDFNNIMAASGFGGELSVVGRDGKPYSIDSPSGRAQFRQQYKGILEAALPPEFRKNGELASRWTSLMTEMMYLEARSMEPGSKQFSDADIQHMAAMIGANINNPATLQKIVMSSYERAYGDLEYRMQMYPPSVRDVVITQESRDRLDKQYADTKGRWEQPLVETDIPASKTGAAGTPQSRKATLERYGIPTDGMVETEVTQTPAAQQTSPLTTGSRGPQRRR